MAIPTPSTISYAELPPRLRELLAPRVERLGYLGAFFQHAAHQPEALEHFVRFTEALKQAVPFRLAEAVALSIAAATGNPYERVQHERLALADGFAPDEVRALVEDAAGACSTLTPGEVAAAALARALAARHGHGCEEQLARLQQLVGEPIAVGCLMLAGRYLAHAAMSNAWRLAAPVPSPLAATEAAL